MSASWRPRIAVLSEQGSHATSIKEIAKAAGVAPGLVHYYFEIDAGFAAVEQQLMALLERAARGNQ